MSECRDFIPFLLCPLRAELFSKDVEFILCFAGDVLFNVDSGISGGPSSPPTVHFTIIFNTFVLMQLFNEINARKVHGERNVFTGIHTNAIFIGVVIGTLIAQVSLCYFLFLILRDCVGVAVVYCVVK